jgi:hypothetical protein
MKLTSDGFELRQTFRSCFPPPERGIAGLALEPEFSDHFVHEPIL